MERNARADSAGLLEDPLRIPEEPFGVQEKYNLPSEVVFCKNCCVSNQRPRIRFDDEGVCSACRFAERKRIGIDWALREKQLQHLCDRFRSKNGEFDVIVPCSGGKDSGFTIHKLKHTYGMHPLAVTWAPHIYTEVGRQNFQALVDRGFDNILGTANGEVHRLLTRLAFVHLGDPFQPFIYGQKAFPIRLATQMGIPLVMYGENGEVEYGGDSKNEDSPTHNVGDDLEKHYFSGIGPRSWMRYGLTEKDLHFYMPPPQEAVQRAGVECHFFGYYTKWVPQENYYYCAEHTGFRANPFGRSEGTYSKYASLDDRIDGFHYYMAYIKFGLGRATSDAAHEIRDGHITREEAVALVRRYDGEFPARYFQEFLDYTGLTEEQFWTTVDRYRSPHLWDRNGTEWVLKHQVS